MFTGIISGVGQIDRVEAVRGGLTLAITSPYAAETIEVGASIACDGCCLTVTSVTQISEQLSCFSADVSAETLTKTTVGDWSEGRKINLERSLKLGDELGGHIVSGHVDGVGRLVEISPEGNSQRFRFDVPEGLAPYIANKGSVALNGTSLTVVDVAGCRFSASLIPHTCAVTTWGHARVGERINVEIDMLARYVARLAEFGTR